MALGENLKNLRRQAGLTQEQVARQMGVTRQAVSGYESGRREPDIAMLEKFAALYHVDIPQLLYGQVQTPRPWEPKRLMALGLKLAAAVVLVAAVAAVIRYGSVPRMALEGPNTWEMDENPHVVLRIDPEQTDSRGVTYSAAVDSQYPYVLGLDLAARVQYRSDGEWYFLREYRQATDSWTILPGETWEDLYFPLQEACGRLDAGTYRLVFLATQVGWQDGVYPEEPIQHLALEFTLP